MTDAAPMSMLTSTGFGRRVGLRVPPSLVDEVRTALPWWWREATVEPEQWWDVPSAAESTLVVSELELWVAEHTVEAHFVHAGAVVVDGRALLLPGESFSGKSTLVAALLAAGAGYCSDEFAVLDAAGMVHAYPRPISLRRPDGTRPRVTARELGAEVVTGPVPLGAVAVLRYDAAGWAVRDISPATAVLALLENSPAAQCNSEALVDAYAAAVSRPDVQLFTGTRGEAGSAARTLLAAVR